MRIGQVSERVGLPISTLRYYERRGIIRPGRSPEGYRDYTEQDLAWIAFVQRLLATGMPLAQVQEYARLRHEGDSTVPQRLEMLYKHRGDLETKLQELQEQMGFLNQKIQVYLGMMKAKENIGSLSGSAQKGLQLMSVNQ